MSVSETKPISEMLHDVQTAGLTIKLSGDGLALAGNREAAETWFPVLRELKAEIISFLAESQSSDAIKTAALATGTPWRPEKIFFLRDVIPDASMDESYEAYWRAVRYVGSGHPPERALQFTVADVLRERKANGYKPNPWLSRRASK